MIDDDATSPPVDPGQADWLDDVRKSLTNDIVRSGCSSCGM